MVDLLTRFRGEEGLALARAAIDELASQSAPTNPPNYEIWTSYLAGTNPELSREIEDHLRSGKPITDELREDLFERYFARTRLSVQMLEASASIARELDDVVTSLRGAGALAGSYANELHDASSRMEDGTDPAAFRTIVAGLAVATRNMAAHNHDLEKQMQASSRQVETLQTTLQEVRIEALTDGLTGLANRKHFDHSMQKRIAEADACRSDLCLVLCDIDHFKRFNDTWGHQVGDHVIRFVSGVLQAQAKNDQLPARYGGEEFALVLPRMHLRDAEALAERIRNAVRERKLSRRSTGEIIGQVTLSFGVAKYAPGETASNWLARADRCLYVSKEAGRDRVTTETDLKVASAA